MSNLSRYVKYGDMFNRPAPNVYGLIDFNQNPEASENPGLGGLTFDEDIEMDEEEEAKPV